MTLDLMACLVLLVTKVIEVRTVDSVHLVCLDPKENMVNLEEEAILDSKAIEVYLEREETKEEEDSMVCQVIKELKVIDIVETCLQFP